MERLLRIKHIVGDKRNGIPPLIPISKSSWWAGVAEGKFPTPIKLGARTTCWRETEVLALIAAKVG
jgi:prophage regulatory protein